MNGMCLKCRDEDTGTGRNIGVNSAQSDVKEPYFELLRVIAEELKLGLDSEKSKL
ncbi:14953_t:CDS:2 [Entrophospora sp. SA101]|nr:14953_t:CDS:2 [Entrophospora sp. SA101]